MVEHEAISGKCEEVMASMPPNSVDLIIADPPYGNVVDFHWDNVPDYLRYTERWLSQARRVLKENGSIFVWCSIGRKSSSLLDVAAVLKREMIFRDMIVWKKQRGRGNIRGWLFVREEILWATKSEKYKWNKKFQYSTEKYHESWIKRLGKEENPFKRLGNVWIDVTEDVACSDDESDINVWTGIPEPTIEMAIASGGRGPRKPLHPCQKPVSAISRMILSCSDEGDTVLDPFLGSGSTLIACEMHGRKCIGIESNYSYLEISRKRLEDVRSKNTHS